MKKPKALMRMSLIMTLYILLIGMLVGKALAQTPPTLRLPGFGVAANHGKWMLHADFKTALLRFLCLRRMQLIAGDLYDDKGQAKSKIQKEDFP